ncbi:hypothetical protein [Citromicrobium bathyomarinum]|uniref:hypothetical protein n=1 Tax=Citromicrobium bathyomarinum TaxID=72174 RepID=UPI00315A4839
MIGRWLFDGQRDYLRAAVDAAASAAYVRRSSDPMHTRIIGAFPAHHRPGFIACRFLSVTNDAGVSGR